MRAKPKINLDRRLGEMIAAERRRLRLSQQQLATRARLSVKTVSNLEQGVVAANTGDGTKAGVEESLGWAAGDFDRVRAGGQPTHRGRVVTEVDENEIFVYQTLKIAPPEAFQEVRRVLERYLPE